MSCIDKSTSKKNGKESRNEWEREQYIFLISSPKIATNPITLLAVIDESNLARPVLEVMTYKQFTV